MKFNCHTPQRLPRHCWSYLTLTLLMLGIIWTAGCSHRRAIQFSPDCEPCQNVLHRIEYPAGVDESGGGEELFTGPPITINNFPDAEYWDLTLDECVELALANSKIMQKLGGVVVNSPAAVTTLYNPALVETNPLTGPEGALSAFDARITTSLFMNHRENKFNNAFFGGGSNQLTSTDINYRFDLSKQTASGARLAVRTQIDSARDDNSFNRFQSTWNVLQQFEVRQPLLQGAGTAVNRIAGPGATPGNYNGVLIARIRTDVSLADFEAAVRNLVRDVENNYWDLHFGYRNLHVALQARDAARQAWDKQNLLYEGEVGRPDDVAQAARQYFQFQTAAQDALTGVLNGQPGVLGAERNLRRLMGIAGSDGRIIRPITEPALAPVVFDWEVSQTQALARRVELRRQKWTIRQRELELLAAKQLNKWRLDLVGQYGFKGFGSDLFGSINAPDGGREGSAMADLWGGDLDDWQFGLELDGPIGLRTGHLAVRNAELNLVREKAVLKEQQRQILLDLNAAYTEVDRALTSLQSNFNLRMAAQDELEPIRERVNGGLQRVFFLLNAIQQIATAESGLQRSIADYNKSLLNYAYTTGDLLDRFNITLTEGPWCEDAQINARKKAGRYQTGSPNHCNFDVPPISRGPHIQNLSEFSSVSTATGAPLTGETQTPILSEPLREDEPYYESDVRDEEVSGDEILGEIQDDEDN